MSERTACFGVLSGVTPTHPSFTPPPLSLSRSLALPLPPSHDRPLSHSFPLSSAPLSLMRLVAIKKNFKKILKNMSLTVRSLGCFSVEKEIIKKIHILE